mmetsp:Transcript_75861/g.180227  ORF Transcript_75861/g.180227 Transcript_75861/m.180227 type:complete len:106 (+) Transcript_75861:393-710(+)
MLLTGMVVNPVDVLVKVVMLDISDEFIETLSFAVSCVVPYWPMYTSNWQNLTRSRGARGGASRYVYDILMQLPQTVKFEIGFSSDLLEHGICSWQMLPTCTCSRS